MWTTGKLQTILYTAIWQILLTDSFDRRHSTKLETSNITNDKREFHTLNLFPKDEVFMSNQSTKNNTIFISKPANPQSNPQQNQPQSPPQPQPPPPAIEAPSPDCPNSESPNQPNQHPSGQDCYCAPCPPCPPCRCPNKSPKIYIEETVEYEEVVVQRDMLIVGPWTKPAIIILFLNICAVKWSSAGILDWGRASNKIEINIPWLPFENETRCYDELGCINITRDWYHLIYRPLNVFPLPRQVIDTRFILYTRKNPNLGQMLKVQSERSIQKSNFDAKKQTKIIIHGFIDTPLASWVKEMRREFLKHADWNVIVVDWAGGSLPLYTQATANTRLVGLEVAYFVNYLKDNHGLNPKDVHIVGHSLGAHTAGYAGERINKLGRITGLDPAEPYFQGMSDHVRLDANDADLVDVIHTDASSIVLLGYGMSDPVGHIDFYPNNGKEQPGCDLTETPLPLTLIKEGIEEASRVLVACNHVRAIKLFTESINSRCPYIAHRCPTYQHFLQGKCFSCDENNTNCAMMGLKINTNNDLVPGFKYFFTTGKETPFCRRHYKVTLDLARPPRAETWVQGFMKVTLHSDNGVIRNMDLTPHGYEKLEHGTSRSFVVAHPEDIGRIRRIEFYWEYDMDVLQPRSICFLWCNDHLYVASIRVTETKDITARDKRQIETNSKLCSTGLKEYADIASRTSAVFVDDCDDDLL